MKKKTTKTVKFVLPVAESSSTNLRRKRSRVEDEVDVGEEGIDSELHEDAAMVRKAVSGQFIAHIHY